MKNAKKKGPAPEPKIETVVLLGFVFVLPDYTEFLVHANPDIPPDSGVEMNNNNNEEQLN
jgi:hypothetical protein